jgi:hypothetical protein
MVEALASETADEPLTDRVHVGVEADNDLDVGALGDGVERSTVLAVV